MKHLRQFIAASLCLLAATVQAQKLLMHFDFSRVSGTTVTDKTSNRIQASLKNGAWVETIGRHHVLNLSSADGYLDLTPRAGDLLKQTDRFSISTYYYVPQTVSLKGNGFFLWAFSTHEACGATEGRFLCYRLNAQRIETSIGGYTQETGYEIGKPSATGRWIHVAYTLSNGHGVLYIDGQQVGTVDNVPANSSNFGSRQLTACWLGRPPFQGDQYLRDGRIADFRLYDNALSAQQVAKLAAKTATLPQPQPANAEHAPSMGLSRHNFFYAGEAKNRDVYIVKQGKIAWEFHDTKERGEISDAILMSDGHMLLAHQFGLKEIDQKGNTIWRIDAPKGTEIHTVQPIGKRYVVYVQNGKPLKAIVMEIPSKRIVKELELPYDPKGGVHGQVRCARLTSRGTLLVAMMVDRMLYEIDSQGRVLNELKQPNGIWGIELQPNGNMLLTGNSIISEVTAAGEPVWSCDLSGYIPKSILQKSTRLKNGNTVVTNWWNEWSKTPVDLKNPPVQAIEVTPSGKKVWELKSWSAPAALGPATTFQLISEPVKRGKLHFGEFK